MPLTLDFGLESSQDILLIKVYLGLMVNCFAFIFCSISHFKISCYVNNL